MRDQQYDARWRSVAVPHRDPVQPAKGPLDRGERREHQRAGEEQHRIRAAQLAEEPTQRLVAGSPRHPRRPASVARHATRQTRDLDPAWRRATQLRSNADCEGARVVGRGQEVAAGFFCRSSFALRSATFASISSLCFLWRASRSSLRAFFFASR